MWLGTALLFGLLGLLWGAGGARRAGEAVSRSGRRMVPGAWRPGVGVLALLALVAALVLAVRADWLPALIALGVALVTAVGVRRGPVATPHRRRRTQRSRSGAYARSHAGHRSGSRGGGAEARGSGMTRRDAASLLGVAEGAPAEEVRAAHTRLMRRLHPDLGGTAGLAAQLNLARAVLLGER